jgi:hypothetical protein
MVEDVASIVICAACGDQVAEILVDGERALCSECHLSDALAETARDDSSDLDE